jgi:hypothetical protein
MIQKAVLTLVAKNYCGWLEERFPPSGKPAIRPLEAEVVGVISALGPGDGPDVGAPGSLTEANVKAALEWVLATVADANAGNNFARLFCHSARIDHLPSGREILDRITSPKKSLDSAGEFPAVPPPKRP